MTIRIAIWDRIREQFSEDEKAELRRAFNAYELCPYPGWIIDEDRISAQLRSKLSAALGQSCAHRRFA